MPRWEPVQSDEDNGAVSDVARAAVVTGPAQMHMTIATTAVAMPEMPSGDAAAALFPTTTAALLPATHGDASIRGDWCRSGSRYGGGNRRG